MAFNGSCQIYDVFLMQRVAQQGIGADETGNRARRGGTQSARLRNVTVLDKFETRHRLAANIIHALCALINQIALIARHMFAMRRENLNGVVLLHIKCIV